MNWWSIDYCTTVRPETGLNSIQFNLTHYTSLSALHEGTRICYNLYSLPFLMLFFIFAWFSSILIALQWNVNSVNWQLNSSRTRRRIMVHGWHCIHILNHHLEFYAYASDSDHRDQYVASFRTESTEMQTNWKADENNTSKLLALQFNDWLWEPQPSPEKKPRIEMREGGLRTCTDSLGTMENNWLRNQFN